MDQPIEDAAYAVTALDGPRLELDQLLAQLVDRAQDVISTQGRLRGLLHANKMVVENLALPIVLRRIVEAACELVHAQYGALAVLGPDGGMEQFIHVGFDADTVARIGHLPEGKGLLRALIDDPHPIRLAKISEDDRSVGFPPNHPPMNSFLGVPIRVRDEIFGNLYLTGYADSKPSADDEELVASLAATAGVAIENARLFEESRQRQLWLQASTEVTRLLLSNEGEEPLHVIARRVEQVADADAVNVVLPTADGSRLMVEVATGLGAEELSTSTYPMTQTVCEFVLRTGEPLLIADMASELEYSVHLSEVVAVGPLMVLPLAGAQGVRGVFVVGRLHGRAQFTEADLNMAVTFGNHASVAMELADARLDQERISLLEDRDRIARDLHDHVIQRLFGAGLTVESVAAGLGTGSQAERLGRVVNDIDETIRQIRTSIFRLRGPLGPETGSVRASVLGVVAELTPTLGFEPGVAFRGAIDSIVNEHIHADLIAVMREGLTNVARHAHATSVDIVIEAGSGLLTAVVADNGCGMSDSMRRSGLANLTTRAEASGGTLTLSAPTRGGTRLTWTAELI